ncbi:MAG: RNA-directed DNA polymerase [Gammaproteobacteria bacterium]
MAKKYRNLIETIVSDDNMRLAYERTLKGKRQSAGYLEWKEYAEVNLAILARELRDGTYYRGPFHQFFVSEPKVRQISALPFRDRVAQHALCNVIGPVIEAMLLPRCFACRPGLGTHAGVKAVQSDMRRLVRQDQRLYYLKTDFHRYFYSIDRRVLHGLIRKKISCAGTLRIIDAMLPAQGKGIPIGSLTSQYFANLYGGVIDRLLQQELKHQHWARYMDDIVVLHHDPDVLRKTLNAMRAVSKERLGLKLSKWTLAPVNRGVNFLGYRIWPKHKLLRRSSVTRARRAINSLRARGDEEALAKFLAAWTGHANWADSHNLLRHLEIAS